MAALVFELRLSWYNIYQYLSHPMRLTLSATFTMTTGTDSPEQLRSHFRLLKSYHRIAFQNSVRNCYVHQTFAAPPYWHKCTIYMTQTPNTDVAPTVSVTLVCNGAGGGRQRSLQYFLLAKNNLLAVCWRVTNKWKYFLKDLGVCKGIKKNEKPAFYGTKNTGIGVTRLLRKRVTANS